MVCCLQMGPRNCFTLEAVLKWGSKQRNRIGSKLQGQSYSIRAGVCLTQCSHSHSSDGEECKDRVASSFPDAAPLLQNPTGLRLLLDPCPTAAKSLFPCKYIYSCDSIHIGDFHSHLESSVKWGSASPYFKFAVQSLMECYFLTYNKMKSYPLCFVALRFSGLRSLDVSCALVVSPFSSFFHCFSSFPLFISPPSPLFSPSLFFSSWRIFIPYVFCPSGASCSLPPSIIVAFLGRCLDCSILTVHARLSSVLLFP